MDPQKNYFRVSHQITESNWFIRLRPASKVLYLYLCKHRNRYTNSKRDAFARSDRQLAKDTGLSIPTIYKSRNELVEGQFIRYDKLNARSGRYCIF